MPATVHVNVNGPHHKGGLGGGYLSKNGHNLCPNAVRNVCLSVMYA
jgi:hypothetical protein